MKSFEWIRLGAFIWSAGMIMAVESVGVLTQGMVELEAKNTDLYEKVLFASLASFGTPTNKKAAPEDGSQSADD